MKFVFIHSDRSQSSVYLGTSCMRIDDTDFPAFSDTLGTREERHSIKHFLV